MFENAELIHTYTRAQALADGVLLDVSYVASLAGDNYAEQIRVGLTAAPFEGCPAACAGKHPLFSLDTTIGGRSK
jgi:hypothetical protein